MQRQQLIDEYDAYYLADPLKWAGKGERNEFAIGVLSAYDPPRDILDVGCGNGHTLQRFARSYPEASLFGIDLSPEACKIASEKLPQAQISRTFVEEYTGVIPFDLVLCLGVAEHFTCPLDGLLAIRKLTAGRLYLEIPDCLSYSQGKEEYRRLRRGSRQMEWHLSRDKWENIIIDAGFEIERAIEGNSPSWRFVWVLK
jgi:trans-aconitate methyltransferase